MISLRHAAFRALRLSTPAYSGSSAAALAVPARGLLNSIAFPSAVRWNTNEAYNGGNSDQNQGSWNRREGQQDYRVQRTRFRPARPAPEPSETVYVGNLFFDVTAEQLQSHCEQFGTVENVRIIYDARGLSKGFGYVRFDSIDAAKRCIDEMNMQVYQGRRAACNFAHFNSAVGVRGKQGDGLSEPSKTLFIGNLAFEMTDRDLNDLFKDIENVVNVRVSIDRRTGRPRGFAHADFVDVESATRALETLQGRVFFGRNLKLDYTYGRSATNAKPPQEEQSSEQRQGSDE